MSLERAWPAAAQPASGAEDLRAALPEHLDLEFTMGELPFDLPASHGPAHWIRVSGDTVLVRLTGGRRLMVTAGQRVSVQWPQATEATLTDPSWLIQSWAVPIAMMQRGLLTLHASTVRIGSRTVAIAGDSGAGKSTTAWALHGRGHEFVVDETTICEISEGSVTVLPFRRRVHLTQQATERLGMPAQQLRPVDAAAAKVSFLPQLRSTQPIPLHQVLLLDPGAAATSVTAATVTGVRRIDVLSHLAQRRGLAPAILGRKRYLELLCALAEAVDVQVISRPKDVWTLPEVLATVQALQR